jgi:hypothetical protein
MSLRHFYLSVPSADGVFVGNRASEDFEEGISIYKFELFKDDSNKASFWLAKEAIEFALDDVDRRIKPVCDSVNYLDKNIHHVETIKPGVAKLLPSGNWKIETKAEIKYLEVDEQKRQEELQKAEELKKQIEMEAKAKEAEAKLKEAKAKAIEAETKVKEAEAKLKESEAKAMDEATKKAMEEAIKKAHIEAETKIAEEKRKAKEAAEALKKATTAQKKAEAEAEKLKQQKAKQTTSSQGGCGKKIGCTVIILIALGIIGTLTEKIDISKQIDIIKEFDIFKHNESDFRWYTSNPKVTNFTISTAEELASLAQIVNGTWGKKPKRDNFAGKTITLAKNIDLSQNNNWVPIGNHFADSNNVFSGTFNGGGYVINNLTINRPDADIQGLFGYIDGGKVQNLGLDNINIIGRDSVGSVVGVVNKGSSITNCYSIGLVNGTSMVGGVAGAITGNSSLANSYSTGKVSGDDGVGGLAGMVRDNSSVTHSYSAATVSGRTVIGGVAGAITGNSAVANCAALNPEVKGNVEAGRVVSNAWNGFTFSNNVAYNGMINNAGNTVWNNKGMAARDGADITIATIKRDGTIGGRFTTKNGWKVQNGSLPEIGNVVTISLQGQNIEELEPISITDSSMYYIPVRDDNGFHKYITLEGKNITETSYIRAYVFREGRALVQEKDSTWGYIDTEGNYIAKGYTQGLSFKDGIAWINDNGIIKAINLNGNTVKTLPRDIISVWAFYEDLALFSANGMQNYLDKDFNEVFWDYFPDGNRFQENVASVMCDNGKYRYIDKNLEYITNCVFDEARIFKNSKAIVRIDNGWGIIDKEGKYILQPSNNNEAIIQDDDMFKFKEKNGNWGWLNSSGKVAIQPIFEEIMNFGNRNFAPVRQGSLWGYIDKNGKYVLDLQYKVAYPFINDRAFVKFEDGYFATIDKNGTKDLQTKYQKFDNSYWEVINSGVASEPKIMTVKPSSFSCDKKTSNDEKTAIRMICKSFNLIELDNKMNKLYEDKKNNPDIAEFNKTFLAERNNCKDISCLERVYETRIEELDGI